MCKTKAATLEEIVPEKKKLLKTWEDYGKSLYITFWRKYNSKPYKYQSNFTNNANQDTKDLEKSRDCSTPLPRIASVSLNFIELTLIPSGFSFFEGALNH
ncbi:hypothetical protein V9T40_004879 [Parthenolecanium corni]|uniref:Uncharacterized protein n=1 Tax=Parthenolecanium corni TaxID=536013 RepID=A0AAN9TEN5_9HEMI